MMRLLFIVALCLVFCASPLIAQSRHVLQDAETEPETKAQHPNQTVQLLGTEKFCDTCVWLQVSGAITEATSDQVVSSLIRYPFVRRVHLDSPGGDLGAAIALGEQLRAMGVSTMVAGFYTSIGSQDRLVSSVRPGSCLSSCVYLLAAGKQRSIVEGSSVGVHQFYKTADSSAPTSGDDLAIAQYQMSMISLYLSNMGVDPLVASIAAATPSEEMTYLDRQALFESRLITEAPMTQADFEKNQKLSVPAFEASITADDPFGDNARRPPSNPSVCEQPYAQKDEQLTSEEAIIVNRFWREICRTYFNVPPFLDPTTAQMQSRWNVVFDAMQDPPRTAQMVQLKIPSARSDMLMAVAR